MCQSMATGAQVTELGSGGGSYAFDFVVDAVRRGFEGYQVYLNSAEVTGLMTAQPAAGDPPASP